MSLIVGIRCVDGVVIAASGPASWPSADGLPAARQQAKRLRVVAGQAVLGVAAHDGLAQEMALSLERCLVGPDRGDTAEDVIRAKIRDALAAPIQRTVAIHQTLHGLPGFATTSNDYLVSHSILAIPLHRTLRLYALDPECSLTEITEELCCAAVGQARSAAEPFLLFLRRVLIGHEAPKLSTGELAAYWTVHQAVGNNVAGVTHPIQVISVARSPEGSIEIVERGEDEIAALRQAMEKAEERIEQSFRGATGGDGKPTSNASEKPVRKRVPEVRLTLQPPERKGRERW